jgi:hypothetical protein
VGGPEVEEDTASPSGNCPLGIVLTLNMRSLLRKKTSFVKTTSFRLSIGLLSMFREHCLCDFREIRRGISL